MKTVMVLAAWLLVMGLATGAGLSGSEKGRGIGMPEKYEHMKNKFWDDLKAIEIGEKIYRGKCLICHGENGDGRGPASAVSPVKPADFTKKDMVATMGDGYWFWRVAEGGAFPPFNSIMPSFDSVLTEEQIWKVISYEHTFSHKGPHEHVELREAEPHKHHEHED